MVLVPWGRDQPGVAARAAALGVGDAGMKAMTHALAEADLREVLPRIGVPTLLLYGGRDVRSIGENLLAGIPSARLTVIGGVGHLCNLEAADRFNAEVRAFLAQAP